MTTLPPGLDHVAIAVKDLDLSVAFWRDALGLAPPEIEDVPSQQARVAIFGHGRGRIELVCPTAPDSGVARFLAKHGEGLHHVCVEVPDLELALARLKARGLPLIDEAPRPGAGGSRIAFLHPKAGRGILVELKEAAPLGG